MNVPKSIGIFDSGAGGLSVLQAIRTKLPNEHITYIADSAYAPYGDQTSELITQRSLYITEQLIKNHAKAIVVACNTATVHAIKTLREQFDTPIIGIEPGIKPAIETSQTGCVGIMATLQTTQSESFKHLVQRVTSNTPNNHAVVIQPCPGLVQYIESGQIDSEETQALLKVFMLPLFEAKIDTLVLGCTHYVFLSKAIERLIQTYASHPIRIIHTQDAVAKETERRLREANALNSNTSNKNSLPPQTHYFTTGDTQRASSLFSNLLKQSVRVKKI